MNGCLRNVVFKPRQLTRNTVGPGGQVGRSVAEPGETQHYYTPPGRGVCGSPGPLYQLRHPPEPGQLHRRVRGHGHQPQHLQLPRLLPVLPQLRRAGRARNIEKCGVVLIDSLDISQNLEEVINPINL